MRTPATRRGRRIVALAAVSAVVAPAAPVAVARHKDEFFIQRAKLTRQADGSWSGPGTLDGVAGRLTITGEVLLLQQERHTVHWTWKAGARRVAGCAATQVLSRPHDVQLWDGDGRITSTSAQERQYRGRRVALYGPTQRADLTHAQISVRQFTPSLEQPTHNCG